MSYQNYRNISQETLAKLRVIHLGDKAKYRICFGYAKQNYQWKIIDEFVKVALDTIQE